MPNGGHSHCGNCRHYQRESRSCVLRSARIESPLWTTCRSLNVTDGPAIGPIYAIVCEVRNGAGSYTEIPYFDGIRVDTKQGPTPGNTVVAFSDSTDQLREFVSTDEYLMFYAQSGRKF